MGWGALYDNWVDIATLAVALVYGWVACSRVTGQRYLSKETGLATLHGLAIFPLFLLVLASVLPAVLDTVLHSNRIILAGAGLVALFSMLENPEK